MNFELGKIVFIPYSINGRNVQCDISLKVAMVTGE